MKKYLSKWFIAIFALLAIIINADHFNNPETGEKEQAQASGLCAAKGAYPSTPFTTDGCSMFPDGPWRSCCVAHDMSYWCGGSSDERLMADREFRTCVNTLARPIGTLAYVGVRIGGHPLLPFPWRWEYGFPFLYSYTDK